MQTTCVNMIFSMNYALKFYMQEYKVHVLNSYFILFGNENNSMNFLQY